MNKIAVCLFFLFLITYNSNLRNIENGDAIPASLLPFSIIENHNLHLDQHDDFFEANPSAWMVKNRYNHTVSVYPVVVPIIITPLYILPYTYLKINGYPINMIHPGFHVIVELWEKLVASSIAALAGVFVFLALTRVVSNRAAIIAAIMFAVGTNTWATSSQNLWQHGLSELILAMLLYIIFSNNNTKKDLLAMGALSGLFVFNRPADSILLLPILYYVFKSDNRLYYAVGCVTGLPFAAYNLYYFGSIMGGMEILFGGLNIYNIGNALGLLVSPSRGILIYSPIIVLAVFGYFKSRRDPFCNLMVLSILAEIAIYGSFVMWFSGGSYGPRFLTGALPFLFVLVGIYLDKLDLKRDYYVIFFILILFAWSIFVQVVGTFYYPGGGWANIPTGLDVDPGRLWDWGDMEIFRNYNAGAAWIHPIESLRPLFS